MTRRLYTTLKVGGCALTNKNDYCSPNMEAVRAFARALSAVWPRVTGALFLVLGGGSFGNAIPRRFRIEDPRGSFLPQDLFRMTAGMMQWASLVVTELAEHGVPAYPFQSSALFTLSEGRPQVASLDGVAAAMERGLLPVLTGDLLLDGQGRDWFRIVSSDSIPGLLHQRFPLERAVMMSDVDGVYASLNEASSLFRRVDASNQHRLLEAAGPSAAQDITGGMKTKVREMLDLLEHGVFGVICRANPEIVESALLSAEPPGTLFIPEIGRAHV